MEDTHRFVDDALGLAAPATEVGLARDLSRALTLSTVLGKAPPTIDRFIVESLLGRGGMSTVFACKDPKLGRQVAIKLLRPQSLDAADLEAEARTLAKLAHPNVVTVFDIGEVGGQVFVAMELVEGGDATVRLESSPSPAAAEVLSWFIDAARGLAAAHDAGIVHRDFKLENLLIGVDGRARVTDFGLASLEDPDASPTDASSPTLAGTPGYIAPELLQGERATSASDQYAFFIAFERALRATSGEPPGALRELIARGTHEDPSLRFESMTEVEGRLRALTAAPQGDHARAREVLIRRVRRAWVEGVRAPGLNTLGFALSLPVTRADEYLKDGSGMDLLDDARDAVSMSRALGELGACLVLVGSPGSGKTLTLVEVAEAMISRASLDPQLPLPVLLNLSSFDGDALSFDRWLLDEVVTRYALPRARVRQWIDSHAICPLLDGLDELAKEKRRVCIDALNTFRRTRPLPLLLSCREDEYRDLPNRLDADAVSRIEPATPSQVSEALSRKLAASQDAARLADSEVELMAQLSNPLLLTMFLELREHAEFQGLNPEELRERLYQTWVARALRPDSGKGTEAPGLHQLRWLASAFRRTGRTELWFESMQTDWLATPLQRFVSTTLALLIVFCGAFAFNMWGAHLTGQGPATGILWGAAAALSALAINRGLQILPMEAMGWSWPRFWQWFPFNVGMGVIAGAAHGYYSDSWVDMLVGAATGLLGMAMIGLAPAGRERRVYPGAGLIESIRNASITAPLIGIVLFVGIAYVTVPLVTPLSGPDSMYRTVPDAGFRWGLTMGFSGGYATWIATGMWAPIAHACLRVVLSLSSPLPLRLTAWLDDLSQRDLLRSVGGGWMFRHHTIREWLADQHENTAATE